MSEMNKQKALLLDRDGTINKMVKKFSKWHDKEIDDTPFIVEELSFNEGIKEVVESARNKGYKIVVITNQPSIVKGDCTLKDYEEVTKRICEYLDIKREDIFECLHKEGISLECACRKPMPGLIYMAKGMHNLDLENSIMVGDAWKDIAASKEAGVGKSVFLKRKASDMQFGNSESEDKMKELNITPEHIIEDIKEMLDVL